ncbi:cytochrome-b5 reductase [Malassezia vespertilionis]|uniref:NADH-cytochrome b5 reductase n=1 Tax=Malassezia vespertilionis TaxID=2020962 RepID=A0A2N1JCF8_9BASI|nr:cytochrome-b5 reductase [Malassezia vespertilionis]PKI84228.1 Mcr1p [Malassezia vespertilionis]WFD06574.1 cytochrome-b5 reductase [Malassezia vespertilionis]
MSANIRVLVRKSIAASSMVSMCRYSTTTPGTDNASKPMDTKSGTLPSRNPKQGVPSRGNMTKYFTFGVLVGVAGYFALHKFDREPTSQLLDAGAHGEPAFHKEEFRKFRLKRIDPHNHDTSLYVFELPSGNVSGAHVACAVAVMGADGTPKNDFGEPLARGYTPLNPPHTRGEFELLIKHYPEGKMTQHLLSLRPGDEILVKGPREKFPYKANEFDHIGMIAGGTGIAPMWQVLSAIASNPDDATKVTLLFGNKTEADILLRRQLNELAKDKRFNIIHYLDNPPANWNGEKGYITAEEIKKHLPAPSLGAKTKVFVSGPSGQIRSIIGPKREPNDTSPREGALADVGYSAEQAHKF